MQREERNGCGSFLAMAMVVIDGYLFKIFSSYYANLIELKRNGMDGWSFVLHVACLLLHH